MWIAWTLARLCNFLHRCLAAVVAAAALLPVVFLWKWQRHEINKCFSIQVFWNLKMTQTIRELTVWTEEKNKTKTNSNTCTCINRHKWLLVCLRHRKNKCSSGISSKKALEINNTIQLNVNTYTNANANTQFESIRIEALLQSSNCTTNTLTSFDFDKTSSNKWH